MRSTTPWICGPGISATLGILLLAARPLLCSAGEPAALTLEHVIALGEVRGRIDHLAVDLGRHRLFVAELGNDSLGVVDLDQRLVLTRITGLSEPQGVAYEAASDTVYVADGGDGVLHRYQGPDLVPLDSQRLGEDADNVRVDSDAHQVLVGYTAGLALIDATTGKKTDDLPLPGHPESFQLEAGGSRVFVNVPDARQIPVMDRASGRQVARWAVEEAQANFPMALDATGQRVLVVFRRPAELRVLAMRDGATIARVPTCGDADDAFYDAQRQRAYISCGKGTVDIVQQQGERYVRRMSVPTIAGARTALFVPELDRLYVAARASGTAGAAIWVLRPAPG